MLIYRAEDGEVFQVNKTLHDIERQGGLDHFLHHATGVEQDAILAYLSDGHRLRDDNLRELAGSSDQAIFVFNKHYLDYEVEDILAELRVEPALQPEITNITSSTLETLVGAGVHHYDFIMHILNTIHVQHEALRIASTVLDLNVLSISDVFERFASGTKRELEKQAGLLEGLELDLEIIGKIRIHTEFLSPAVRRAVEAGEKARTLGDYVSVVKMRQVGEACAKTHNDLKRRFDATEAIMGQLTVGAEEVRSSSVNSSLVDEADVSAKRTQETIQRMSDIKEQLSEPRIDERELFEELHKLDVMLRDEVNLISDLKNKSSVVIIGALRHISHLNNHLIGLPPTLSALQSDFRSKTNFSHIERLHKMLYAYGATLVEVVRRKEFSRFFSQKAQMIAEVMAKLSANERKQRQIFRGEVHGQLPFDAKGIDDAVPAMEITSTGISSISYSIERNDLMMLLDEIGKMEEQGQNNSDNNGGLNGHFNVNSLGETRSRLEKLIMRMDNLEPSFDKMVEKTIFSASRILLPRRQATDHTDGEFQELVEQLHELQDVKGDQERQFEEERQTLQAEVEQLHAELSQIQEFATGADHRAVQLENDLSHALEAKEAESRERSEMERQVADQQVEIDRLQEELSKTQRLKDDGETAIERLQAQLAATRIELTQTKQLEREASQRFLTTLSEREQLSMTLRDTQTQEASLKEQLLKSQQDIAAAKQALTDAQDESERRLRAQTTDADRALRDVIAEADGDRAVLEHQIMEMTALLDGAERQLSTVKAELEVAHADLAGLREELQRTEHEMNTHRGVEAALRSDLESAQKALDDCDARLGTSSRAAKELLRVAVGFRDSYCKAIATAQSSSSSSSKSTANLAESVAPIRAHTQQLTAAAAAASTIDPEDIMGGLQALSNFDLSALPDSVAKMASTIRKWQKQCKEYRDRARSKISFRNFAKGDLALFLPTRNSISKPWAAFNVSFPHYFLQASGNLLEQLKTREWIVARISSIMEQIVDPKDPSTNPYGLSDGTKFYMLQVEDWTQSSSRRKSSPPPPTNTNAKGITTADSPVTPAGPSSSSVPPDNSSAATAPEADNLRPPAINEPQGPRDSIRPRTYSAPVHPSSLSRLLGQGTPPPIEEVPENSASPSPPIQPSSPSPSPGPPEGVSNVLPTGEATSSEPLPVQSPPQSSSSSMPPPPHPAARSSSPLARSGSSPLARSSSPLLVRPSSPFAAGPSQSRTSPTSRLSPTAGTRSQPSSSPLATATPVHATRNGSPLADELVYDSDSSKQPQVATGRSIPTTSGVGAAAAALSSSPIPPSPKSASPFQHHHRTSSRRSSSSSRPSTSSIFSAGRHPFTKSGGAQVVVPKAAATTALSDAAASVTDLSETTTGGAGTIRPRGGEDSRGGGGGVSSPEDSETPITAAGMSSVLLGRRRTASAVSYAAAAARGSRTSPLSIPKNNNNNSRVGRQQQQQQQSSQGALANLASSWGFGRKPRASFGAFGSEQFGAGAGGATRAASGAASSAAGSSASASGASSSTTMTAGTTTTALGGGGTSGGKRTPNLSASSSSGRTRRSTGASDILRRYDDILPSERAGSR